MKILIVTHYFPPHRGGIENVALNQAALLVELGHEVTVITSALPKRDSVCPVPFRVIRIPAMNVLEEQLGVPYPVFSPRLLFALSRAIRATDVVHAHGHVYMTSVLAGLLARYHSKPFVLTQHNTFIEYASGLLRRAQQFADASVGKITIKGAQKVIAVSEATQTYVETLYPTGSVIHYNGVDLSRFRPVNNHDSIRRRLTIPTGKIVCLCVRRVTFKNGIETLLEAAALVRDTKEILFLICGDGTDLQAARDRVRAEHLDNVMLRGPVADEDLPSYYAASDIFILPSMTGEGFPLVILEALASGLPIIATRSGGHVEILESQGCGEIVAPGSAQEIAAQLRSLAVKPSRLKMAASETSREVAESKFSWNRNTKDLLGVFDEVLNEYQ